MMQRRREEMNLTLGSVYLGEVTNGIEYRTAMVELSKAVDLGVRSITLDALCRRTAILAWPTEAEDVFKGAQAVSWKMCPLELV